MRQAFLVILASASALAGCGGAGTTETVQPPTETGDAGAAYERELRAVNASVRELRQGAESATDVDELREDIDAALLRVDQATPPFDALAEHQLLSQALFEAFEATTVGELRARLDEAVEALDELEQKGYDIG